MPTRGMPRFSKENLLSHSTERLRRGTPPSFTIILVAENFKDTKGDGEWEGEAGRNTFFRQELLSHW